MSTRTSVKKKSVKHATGGLAKATGQVRLLTGQALLDDMKAYCKEVSATPESARNFLFRLGVLTASGKAKTLIRD